MPHSKKEDTLAFIHDGCDPAHLGIVNGRKGMFHQKTVETLHLGICGRGRRFTFAAAQFPFVFIAEFPVSFVTALLGKAGKGGLGHVEQFGQVFGGQIHRLSVVQEKVGHSSFHLGHLIISVHDAMDRSAVLHEVRFLCAGGKGTDKNHYAKL